MANDPIGIEYGRGLAALEQVLGSVTRPGTFFACGRAEVPLPKLMVEGVGQLSFPVSASQARELMAVAQLAPYGRGAETVVDTSVRKVWQLSQEAVKLGGKAWEATLASILGKVCEGLGCGGVEVSADLYKLLVYDQGGFFLSHRDTEKAPGMFGTLVVSLPSAHEGGDLVIRHAGEEQIVSLVTDEPSELVWAGLYADCEHEVRPVLHGCRVCLVYNLVQHGKARGSLAPPDVSGPAAQAAKLIRDALDGPQAPLKLAWLLEHHYSPAEMAFTTLKNADAARASVLCAAAALAKCDLHIGIVHIEQSGAAEPAYDSWSRGRGRGRARYGYGHHDEDEVSVTGHSEAGYEIIDVCYSDQSIDTWVAPAGERPAYGKLPLRRGELIPAGALDAEPPDSDRLTEATGNEGASFERSYHRAVLVLWRSALVAEVLLQAGSEAAVPVLAREVQSLLSTTSPPDFERKRAAAVALARRMIDGWPVSGQGGWMRRDAGAHQTSRAEMLESLNHLRDQDLISAFIRKVLTYDYNGTENKALQKSISLMGARIAGTSLAGLVEDQLPRQPKAVVNLLIGLAEGLPGRSAAFTEPLASALTSALPKVTVPPDPHTIRKPHFTFASEESGKEFHLTPELLAHLLAATEALAGPETTEHLGAVMQLHPSVFDPLLMLTPTIKAAAEKRCEAGTPSSWLALLWQHSATSLLSRSSHPPAPPADWSQSVTIACSCADCRELEAFSTHPAEETHRFRVNKDRRQHLHQQINAHTLDMTHVTERKGSPQTLVCEKTRRRYELRDAQYLADLAAFRSLTELALAAGCERHPAIAAMDAALEAMDRP